jgi:Family of unknown function (DUF6339)
MKVRYFRQSKLDALKANIDGNLKRYKSNTVWVEEFFGNEPFSLEADVPGTTELELVLPDRSGDNDLENTRRVYSTFKHLSRAQASDERLWAYMTHALCWEYMRSRWPIEGRGDRAERKSPVAYVRERYFFMGYKHRALVRNGLARLWWYGQISYDPGREDPFELTALLLYTLDITQSLLERAFSSGESTVRGVLLALADWRSQGESMPDRETFRTAMRYLTLLGGVTVLDALGEQGIREQVLTTLHEAARTDAEATGSGR